MYNFFLSCASRYNKLWGEKTERGVVPSNRIISSTPGNFIIRHAFTLNFYPTTFASPPSRFRSTSSPKFFSLLKIRRLS